LTALNSLTPDKCLLEKKGRGQINEFELQFSKNDAHGGGIIKIAGMLSLHADVSLGGTGRASWSATEILTMCPS
jgi:hypothetical protein